MREAFTADFEFEFTDPVSKNCVVLWAHQSVLMLTGAFKTMYDLPRSLDLSFAGVYMFTTARVTEFSLIAHCALLHFMYTGKVPGKIDLREFIILPIPVSSLSNDPVDDLLSSPFGALLGKIFCASRTAIESTRSKISARHTSLQSWTTRTPCQR